ncbi:MAG: carboxypeptidase regulatory-like domain-containing protein [Burkholderiaceae bacterium]
MRFSNTARRTLLGSLCAAALMGTIALPAHAQDELIVVEPAHSIMYLNGGIGSDEAQYMRKIAKDWPLRMVFSESKDNEFVADVSVLITDPRGTPYLQLSGAGPMTYVKLPGGKYHITARFHGQSETREVTLDGKNGREVVFHWKGQQG